MQGINKTLYDKPDRLLTKDEVMENLHIKDPRVFYRLIKEENLPFFKVGRNLLISLTEYNKWIKEKSTV